MGFLEPAGLRKGIVMDLKSERGPGDPAAPSWNRPVFLPSSGLSSPPMQVSFEF